MEEHGESRSKSAEGFASMLAFVGGGGGIAFFVFSEVINASFIGGIVGLNIAGSLTGYPVESNVLARVAVAIGMLGGVMVAGLVFLMVGALTGWLIGKVVDTVRAVFILGKG